MATHFACILLLIAVGPPECNAVRCYSCRSRAINGELLSGEECFNKQENTDINANCSGEFCVKLEVAGKFVALDISEVGRGCDNTDYCADGEDTFSLPSPFPEYPSIAMYGYCSRGDLSNGGLLLCAPPLSPFMLITSITILLQCMMARQS